MRILKFEADSFLRLNVVAITPDGHIVEIAGKNAAGKSSVLGAIYAAIGGGKAVPGKPVHTGKDKAFVRVTLGDKEVELVVERRFVEGGDSRLIIETADGSRKANPQAILNAFVGALTFDPMEFARSKAADQYTMLRSVVKLDVDPEHLIGLNKKDFDDRTELKRDAAKARAQADGIVLPVECPTERRDTAEILDRLTRAASHNADIATRKNNREAVQEKIADLRGQAEQAESALPAIQAAMEKKLGETIADFQAQILALEDKIQRARGITKTAIDEMITESQGNISTQRRTADDLQARLDAAAPLPEPIDADAVRAELTSAEDTNAMVDRLAEKKRHATAAETKEADADFLTERIEARKQELADALARAEMPVPGIGLDYEAKIVTFNGVPFDQASSADQIKTGVALAMALNPKLRVMLIREGSFLDDDNLALLAKMAEENDYQCWVESVRPGTASAVILSDGYVVGHEQPNTHAHEGEGSGGRSPHGPADARASGRSTGAGPAEPKGSLL